MIIRHFKILVLTVSMLLLSNTYSLAQSSEEEAHILVSLRMIGHQVLLYAGDSTSRVLPIEKEGERYKLQFTTDFQFEPGALVKLVDSVVDKSSIAANYRVEIEGCETEKVVYSYEIGDSGKLDLIPCSKRVQPKDCYTLFFTILDVGLFESFASTKSENLAINEKEKSSYTKAAIISLAVMVFFGVSIYYGKRAAKPKQDTKLITIGAYQFDTRNMKLHHQGEVTELTSKEADLLELLHTSANSTLERDLILQKVWGDEGDYIGRTLDVFISKLRKKLEGDSQLKIVNVRGVGYKPILN